MKNYKIFNLDFHVSVIEDISRILKSFGNEVTSWNLSNHSWVFGRNKKNIDIINQDNWGNMDEDMCHRFFDRYKDELSKYDLFLTTHPPALGWLLGDFNKKIISVASVRYEVPFTNKPERWISFNKFLTERIDNGMLIPVANNRYDAAYAEFFLKRKYNHIPNLCDYTNVSYNPRKNQFLYYSRFSKYNQYLGGATINNLIEKNKALGIKYSWDNLVKYKGIVVIPYNCSTMSIFEYYSQAMPMFVPSLSLMRRIREEFPSMVMEECSWTQTWNMESKTPDLIECDRSNDPNNYKNIDIFMNWAKLSDFYDTEYMPHIRYFDSFQELKDILTHISQNELNEISNKMKDFNVKRKEIIYTKWKNIMENI